MKEKITVACPRCTQVFQTRHEYELLGPDQSNDIWGGVPRTGDMKGADLGIGTGPGSEPVFVLRAQDQSAMALVQMWITLNHKAPKEKLKSAQDVLDQMREWPRKKNPD